MKQSPSSVLSSLLLAGAPASDRAAKLGLYGWLVGSWEADIVTHAPDGGRHEGEGEIHFAWALEGRAIQDVWMIPRLKNRSPDAPPLPVAGNWYGTTLRIYDPAMDAWRIYWIDPATNAFYFQIGRRRGADIVQEGTTESGFASRWSFTRITPRSFLWLGEFSPDKGATWRLIVEISARRTSAENPQYKIPAEQDETA
jgi:hypothetical protein